MVKKILKNAQSISEAITEIKNLKKSEREISLQQVQLPLRELFSHALQDLSNENIYKEMKALLSILSIEINKEALDLIFRSTAAAWSSIKIEQEICGKFADFLKNWKRAKWQEIVLESIMKEIALDQEDRENELKVLLRFLHEEQFVPEILNDVNIQGYVIEYKIKKHPSMFHLAHTAV